MTKPKLNKKEVEKEIKKEVNKAIDEGFKLGMKKQILNDLEWMEDNFGGRNVFVWTKEAIIERRAELNGMLNTFNFGDEE